MFTNNYIKLKKMLFTGKSSEDFVTTSGETQTGYLKGAYLGELGQWLPTFPIGAIPKNSSTSSNPSGVGVYFGSGSTPATKDDYTLESPINSSFSRESVSSLTLITDDPNVYSYVVTYTLKNISNSDINIYEMGVITGVTSSSNFTPTASTNVWWPVLMERVVLTEPITIHPGEMKSVTYKITFNQTLNVE